MKLSVCLDAVWSGRSFPGLPVHAPNTADDFVAGMRAAAAAGFTAYEFWGWEGKNLAAIRAAQEELGLRPAAFCTTFFDLTNPASRKKYAEGLCESLKTAKFLGCPTLITQVGNERPEIPRDVQHQSIVDGLKACVPLLEEAGVTLVFEPLNTQVDHKGYYLTSSREAASISAEVGSPFVKVLFDFYHQQIMEGNVIANSLSMLGQIGHCHCAGNPGRHEPDSGELRHAGIFDALDAAGYAGFMGLEYIPTRDVGAELAAWVARYPQK